MKKVTRGFILGIIIATILMSTALGQQVNKTIDVVYNSVNITVNSGKVVTDNILYDGITYVPLRAISEMLGKEVGWDGNTNTASINDKVMDISPVISNQSLVEVKTKANKKINVVYNAVNITVNGAKVATDNILYDGITYVPLRAISEMLGKEVGWDGNTNTASINNKVLSVKTDEMNTVIIPLYSKVEVVPEPPKTDIKPEAPKPQVNPPITDNIEEVYITSTGSKYHIGNCSSLSKSKIPISLDKARQSYEPCKKCNPPR